MSRVAAVPHVMTDRYISVVVKNKTFALDSSHPTFEAMASALVKKQWAKVAKLTSPAAFLKSKANGAVTVANGKVFFKGREIHNSLTKRILEGMLEGKDMKPYILFMNNLYKNPRQEAIDELYDWLNGCNLPITDDGCFVAYKKVRQNYKDTHTGTVDNSPGQVVMMPRKNVDENRHQTCSRGLHFCSADYLGQFGGERILKLKINPKDVVSIPSDYQYTKGRTWRYEVMGEVTRAEVSELNELGQKRDIVAFKTSVFDYEAGRQGLLKQLLEHPHVKRNIRRGKLKATTLKKYPLFRMKKLAERISGKQEGTSVKKSDALFCNPLRAAREQAGLGVSKVAKQAGVKPAALLKLEKEDTPRQSRVDEILIAISALTQAPDGMSYKASA